MSVTPPRKSDQTDLDIISHQDNLLPGLPNTKGLFYYGKSYYWGNLMSILLR